ncbi:MAG: hypothetical protein ACRDOU_06810 [Streptosporangiaceae bacterium]
MSTEASSLTAEQRLVLQTVYDHFHTHASWPSFISIDRPLRREHGIDTAALVLTLPESLIVQPRPGNLRPVAADELRLRLLGIHACQGGSDDTERFVQLLRWLAQQEMAYEPEPDSKETMPRVTSDNVAAYLDLWEGLPDDDFALARLYAMLQLDHWGLGGSGSGENGWYVTLGPDIWRFRDVQTVEDCIRVREEWVSEDLAKVLRMSNPLPAWHYHVRVSTKSKPSWDEVRLDVTGDKLEADFLTPYREGGAIVINGATVPIDDLARLCISRSRPSSTELQSDALFQVKLQANRTSVTPDDWLIAYLCEDVTDQFITEPPGSAVATLAEPSEPASRIDNSYVNRQVIDDIRTKADTSQFNVVKLLRLIEELNENHARMNSYAAHALLRAILDHIPPILGQADFNAIANNYSWSRTDKRYLKKLADFRDQADDALHRQISARADLLDFDDMPSSVYVDRLLQECATRL